VIAQVSRKDIYIVRAVQRVSSFMCISKANDERDNQAILRTPCTAGHPLDGKRVFHGG
jgi:hypothetical protein